MENKRLLECLDADFFRLREVAAAADLTAIVPSCPEWTVADLVQHVGMVYLHKVECMRNGQPNEWPPPGAVDEEPRSLLDRSYAALAAEFATRAPESPAYTWYEPDQTVGFWIRRMAQETVIHRVDAELGAGAPIAAIPADLARDGVDEFLAAFVSYGSVAWHEEFAPELSAFGGGTVRLETDGAAWLVRVTTESVQIEPLDAAGGDAVRADVRGEPSDLLLWAWGRAGDDAVTPSGDPEALTRLRRIFTTASQ